MKPTTEQDKKEFTAYLAACTDAQVRGVLEKESLAKRNVYANLAKQELLKRGLSA